MKFTDLLSEDTKEAWPLIYRRLTGKKWKGPVADSRGVSCELNIDPKEVEQIMKEKPNYCVESESRRV